MKYVHVLLLALWGVFSGGNAGAAPCVPLDTAQLIAQIDGQLSRGEKWLGAVLTDTSLMYLHRLTAFREVIKKHAKAEKLRLTAPSEPGLPTHIEAYVLNPDGEPVRNALVYMYQTDQRGWYADTTAHVGGMEGDRRHARLFGYLRTDANGFFTFETILPQSYPDSELPRHIHCEVFWNEKVLITELLFRDDPKLTPEVAFQARREGFEISKNVGIPRQPRYEYRLTLR